MSTLYCPRSTLRCSALSRRLTQQTSACWLRAVSAQAETFILDAEGAAQLAGLVARVRGSGAHGTTPAECQSPTAAFMADIYEVLLALARLTWAL